MNSPSVKSAEADLAYDDLTQLALAAASQQKGAFERLLNHSNFHRIRNEDCPAICMRRYRPDWQEFAEEMWSIFLKKLPGVIRTFKGESSFRTWASAVLTRIYIDLLRRDQTRSARFEPMVEGFDIADPATEISGIDIRVAVAQALAKLSPLQRQLIMLIDVVGYSQKEAAEKMGYSESYISRQLKEARAKLSVAVASTNFRRSKSQTAVRQVAS